MRKLLSLFALWRDRDWRKLIVVGMAVVLMAAVGVQMDRISPLGIHGEIYASRFAGADCGAKIMAADAFMTNPKGTVLVDSECGRTISTALNVQHSVRFIEGGEWDFTATWVQTHGGIDISGLGLTDAGNNPGTLLKWTGAAGSDLLSVLGLANPRLDRVNIRNLILDSGRYALRMEKVDTVSIYDSRIRNATECNLYNVDATGLTLYNTDFSFLNKRGLCLDWGSGGFAAYHSNFEQVVTGSTGPMVLIQGATNSVHFYTSQFDATHGALVGFIQVAGFAANSSLPSAPTGGAGSPTTVSFDGLSAFYDNGDVTAPSQGADILVSGVSGNNSINVKFSNCYLTGSSISPVAVKVDFATEVGLNDCLSTGHTTGLAATLQATTNAARVRMFGVNSLDTNRIAAGGSSNAIIDQWQAPSGQWNQSGAFVLTGGVFSWLTPGVTSSGDPTAPQGSFIFRSDLNRMRYFDGSTWHSISPTDSPIFTGATTLGSTVVGSLGAATTPFQQIGVTDSTAIATEGQTCVGGSSTKAIAISNGTIWKCF